MTTTATLIHGSGWTVAIALGVLAAAWAPWRKLTRWRPRCGEPMPAHLRPTPTRTYACQRPALHAGRHRHGDPFTIDQVRW